MPKVIYASGVIRDFQRLREFLQSKNSVAAKRAADRIIKAPQVLGMQPQIGRPIDDMSDNTENG